ncbi:MAG: TIGR04283 family arsenosugar biosynthesis glycosyltransferase [Pseudomonadota bacterium]
MKLSIIIPTLNEESNIVALLKKLQYLRLIKHEVIMVDAGSRDTTIELAREWVDQIVLSEKGRAIQQNTAAKKATGNVLLFLHADTQLPENFLDEILVIEKNNQYHWGRFDIQLSGKNAGLRIIEFMINLRSRLTGIATGDQAIFIQKHVFDQINGFANLSLMEDIDLSTRLKKISKPYCSKLKVKTSSRRWENNGLLKTIVLMWWYRLQFFFGVDSRLLEKKYYSA